MRHRPLWGIRKLLDHDNIYGITCHRFLETFPESRAKSCSFALWNPLIVRCHESLKNLTFLHQTFRSIGVIFNIISFNVCFGAWSQCCLVCFTAHELRMSPLMLCISIGLASEPPDYWTCIVARALFPHLDIHRAPLVSGYWMRCSLSYRLWYFVNRDFKIPKRNIELPIPDTFKFFVFRHFEYPYCLSLRHVLFFSFN